jgi:hypothetical protein
MGYIKYSSLPSWLSNAYTLAFLDYRKKYRNIFKAG